MSTPTDSEILAAAKEAIYELLTTDKRVVEFSVAGRSTKQLDLSQLQALEAYYEKKVRLASGSSQRPRGILLADLSNGGASCDTSR